jgi:hypothetical protein
MRKKFCENVNATTYAPVSVPYQENWALTLFSTSTRTRSARPWGAADASATKARTRVLTWMWLTILDASLRCSAVGRETRVRT